eukprot:jgi/Mesvir1/6321/Mv06357-RA.1
MVKVNMLRFASASITKHYEERSVDGRSCNQCETCRDGPPHPSARGGLTIDSVRAATHERLAELLYGVGFYTRKSQYLKQTADICRDSYGGDIPDTLEGLMALPGVGPKMAYLVMNVAWEKVTGICVDIHVHRISNRLHWVGQPSGTTWQACLTPEETRKALEAWLPMSHWSEINPLLVGFGQQICAPVRPKCDMCKLTELCPSAFKSQSPSKQSPAKKSPRG